MQQNINMQIHVGSEPEAGSHDFRHLDIVVLRQSGLVDGGLRPCHRGAQHLLSRQRIIARAWPLGVAVMLLPFAGSLSYADAAFLVQTTTRPAFVPQAALQHTSTS